MSGQLKNEFSTIFWQRKVFNDGGILVYGTLAPNAQLLLLKIDGALNSQTYIQILKNEVFTFLETDCWHLDIETRQYSQETNIGCPEKNFRFYNN